MCRRSLFLAALAFLLPCASSVYSQDAPSTSPAVQADEPPVRSLSDVRPGVSRASVLAGLASDYTLTKTTTSQDPELEVWLVESKTPPHGATHIFFAQGKTLSVRSQLLVSASPDVIKFVDALQSALYDSTNPPSDADAKTLARLNWTKIGPLQPGPPNEAKLAGLEQLQMEAWKMNNQRFGEAQVGASQHHSPEWDERKLSIIIGGRSFEIVLVTMQGNQKVVDFGEFK
jgi:hypothetical protein